MPIQKQSAYSADGVFEGGGVKGIAFAGALAAADEAGIRRWINVAGTSAGSIVAALLAAGYDARELRQVLSDTDYARFADYGFGGRIIGASRNALRLRGICPGNYFREWLRDRFEQKLGTRDPTFEHVERHDRPADVPDQQWERARFRLHVIASDVTAGRMLVLPDDINDYEDQNGRRYVKEQFSLVDAVRMSMSYPFFFDPVRLHQNGQPHYIVDGGLLSNFPVFLFDSPNPKRPTWGFRLHGGESDEDSMPYRKIPRPLWQLPLIKAMFAASMEAWDRRRLSEVTSVRTVSIPTGSIGTTQFTLAPDEVEYLYEAGRRSGQRFFDVQREYLNSFGDRMSTPIPAVAAAVPAEGSGAGPAT